MKRVTSGPHASWVLGGGSKVLIGSTVVGYVRDEEAEKSRLLVCAPLTVPLYFPDSLVGLCVRCQRHVQFRPYAPKRPLRVCIPCRKSDLSIVGGHA